MGNKKVGTSLIVPRVMSASTTSKFSPEEQLQMVEEMSPALRRKYMELSRKIADQAESHIIFYWELGRECALVKKDEETYGPHSVKILAAALNRDPGMVYGAMQFFQEYTKPELRAVIKAGRGMHWSHVRYLLSVPKDQRSEFVNKIAEEELTPNELHGIIRQKLGNRRAGSGRKTSKPNSPLTALNQMAQLSTRLSKQVDEIWFGDRYDTYQALKKTEMGSLNPDHVKEAMGAAQAGFESAQVSCAAALHQVNEMISWFDKAYKQYKKDDEPEQPNGQVEEEEGEPEKSGKRETIAQLKRSQQKKHKVAAG